MRASERSDFYGWMLEPRPSPAVLADARGRKAETADEREAREARRTTMPAPRARSKRPRGRRFDVDDELDATG